MMTKHMFYHPLNSTANGGNERKKLWLDLLEFRGLIVLLQKG